MNRIVADSLVLVNRIVTDSTVLHTALKDTATAIRTTVNNQVAHLQNNIDTTSQHVRGALVDTASAIRADIHDSVLVIKQGDVVLGTFSANQSHNDTITIPTPPDGQVQADWNQTTATAKDYIKNKPNIRDSVNRVVLDSLYAANSAMNKAMDTISRNNIRDSLVVVRTKIHTDSTVLAGKMRTDSIVLVNRIVADSTILAGKMHADSLTLATRMDTVYKHLCDSVMACEGIQTMQRNIATNTTNITNLQNKLHSDSTTLVNRIVADSLALVNRIVTDSTVLAGKMHTDSLVLVNRIVADSLALHTALKDTATAIRNSIGKGTLTIQYGTDAPVTFTANQKTDTSITIPVPTAPNDATLTIQKNGTTVGTFTANQAADQTIDIKVPTCDSLAECDLIISILARLDKLERQNDSLAKEIEKLQPALTVTGPQKDTVCSNSTKTMTYTTTFHNCSSSDYTLAWKVNGTDSSAVTGAVLTLNVKEEGAYEVVCIATRSDGTFVTDTVTTMLTVDDAIPSFTANVNGLTVALTGVTNTATIQWDTDSATVEFSGASATHTYAVADTITITATSEGGCTYVYGLRLQPIAPAVTTDSVGTIAATTAKAYGTVTSDGGVPGTKRGMVYSISATSDETLKLGADGVDSVMSGTGMGSFTCNLTRLVPCTQYYVRAFAYNEVDTVYGGVLNFITPSFTCGSMLTDIDGNEYATLQLGSQCWMKQNLRTTRFADGTEIPKGSHGSSSYNRPYYYEPDSNISTYGRLYNWTAAMHGSASSSDNPSGVQGVCPDGWHLPSDAEWTQLTSLVASNSENVCDNNPAYIAKSLASNEGWGNCESSTNECECLLYNPSTNNSTGFSVLPAGTWEVRQNGDGYYSNYGHSIFRTATELATDATAAWVRQFYDHRRDVERTAPIKELGYSVRCVLDCTGESTYQPTVSVVRFTDTVGTTISMEASVLADGGAEVTARGVCWGNEPHPTTSSGHAACGAGIGDFSVTVDTLTPGVTYYVRAYATNSVGTAYGAEVTFVMPAPAFPPTVNTGSQFLALTEGFEGSISGWIIIDSDGDGNYWKRTNQSHHSDSYCIWSASFDYNSNQSLTPDNYLITPDITIPTGVSPVLTFWYRGYEDQPYYAKEHFLVKVGHAGASTADDFNTQVLEVTSTNEYLQATVDLSAYVGQTIRLAFVHTNSTDKSYLCIDDVEVGVAGAGANIVSDVTATTAVCGGYVSADGGATVTARGVCWSTSPNPTVGDSHTNDGSGTGSFTSNITGLSANTTYYVRAYATNSAGTSYGSQVSFTTMEALPVVTTSAVSAINVSGTDITATCGGDVTDAGAYEVTVRGVCWSTNQNPTISDSYTTDGNGLGSFVSSLTDLSSGTTYYVRAYATNSAGTVYGNQVSFILPVVDDKSCPEARTVTDHEGNVYATVKIGDQCWMRENLRTTTSPKTGTYLVNTANRNSLSISSSFGSKVAHWYYNDSATYAPKGYGLLYNWCAAMDTANPSNYMEVPTPSNTSGNNEAFSFSVSGNHRGICPAGWHLPSFPEWNTLTSNVSSASDFNGGSDWTTTPNNTSGFTALPAKKFGNFNFQSDERAYFWCSTQNNDNVKARCLYSTISGNTLAFEDKSQGLSVRCLRDAGSGGGY